MHCSRHKQNILLSPVLYGVSAPFLHDFLYSEWRHAGPFFFVADGASSSEESHV
jgi:hypothetical protein